MTIKTAAQIAAIDDRYVQRRFIQTALNQLDAKAHRARKIETLRAISQQRRELVALNASIGTLPKNR